MQLHFYNTRSALRVYNFVKLILYTVRKLIFWK